MNETKLEVGTRVFCRKGYCSTMRANVVMDVCAERVGTVVQVLRGNEFVVEFGNTEVYVNGARLTTV